MINNDLVRSLQPSLECFVGYLLSTSNNVEGTREEVGHRLVCLLYTIEGYLPETMPHVGRFEERAIPHFMHVISHMVGMIGFSQSSTAFAQRMEDAFFRVYEDVVALDGDDDDDALESEMFDERMRGLGACEDELGDRERWRGFWKRKDFFRCLSDSERVEELECAICSEEYSGTAEGEARVLTKCGHVFGEDCLTIWTFDKHLMCPMCRGDLFSDDRGKACDADGRELRYSTQVSFSRLWGVFIEEHIISVPNIAPQRQYEQHSYI